MNFVYYGTALKLVLHLYKGKLLSFRCQSGFLRWIDTPSTRRKKWQRLSPFKKIYTPSVDHVTTSNKILFLIPLIMKFLYTTVPIFLPQVACPFQKRITNIVWSSKRSGFTAWRRGGPESCGKMGLWGLGSIRCVLPSMAKDKEYLHHNWMGKEYRESIIYQTSLKCLEKAFIFSSGLQEETYYLLFPRIEHS